MNVKLDSLTIIKSKTGMKSSEKNSNENIWETNIRFMRIIDGSSVVIFDDKQVQVGRGDCIFINSCRSVAIRTELRCRRLDYIIDRNIFPEIGLFSASCITPVIKGDEFLCKLADDMENEYNNQFSYHENFLHALSAKLLIYLYRNHSEKKGKDSISPQSAEYNITQRSLDFIADKSISGISSKDVAQAIGVSNEYLDKCFRVTVGTTPTKIINSVRCRKATEMLDRGLYSVTEVAILNGFRCIEHFIREYKKYAGITPGMAKKSAKARHRKSGEEI